MSERSPRVWDANERRALGRSFDSAAREYEAGRPGYPDELIDWWASLGAFPPGGRVLDLAAGTGKLTRALLGRGVDVVAVEPLAGMRAELRSVPALAGIEVLEGAAEAMPLPSASVDAVVVGQAFHWFDPTVALPEIARVLRPGGGLGLAWNDDDLDGAPAWVRLVHERKESIGGGNICLAVEPSQRAVDGSGLFELLTAAAFRWKQPTTAAAALDSLASRSYVIAMDDEARRDLLAEVVATIGASGDTPIDHPLITAAFWAARA
ncbi:MAG: class I SAM-dependent methyltransferase [Ilumatobacteraceae bacterium]